MTGRWLRGWALGYAAVGRASLFVPLYALALGYPTTFAGGLLMIGLLLPVATGGAATAPSRVPGN